MPVEPLSLASPGNFRRRKGSTDGRSAAQPDSARGGLLQASGMTVAEQVRQRDAVPAAIWDRSDALRPLDLCRLARATVSP
jgi:hypothetical protein